MARKRRRQQNDNAPRPVAVNDFIYEETDDHSSAPSSDTPEEAVRKLRARTADDIEGSADDDSETVSEPVQNHFTTDALLDESKPSRKPHRPHPFLRGLALAFITLVLLLSAGSYILRRITGFSVLSAPENVISAIVTPVQTFFSGISESVAGYFRTLKLRSNIEAEYNALRAENEQLVYKAMLAEELQQTLSKYEDLSDEIAANSNMNPLVATVIGRSDANYFSTMTINKGKKDGVKDYMAVTISGALVGYTENVQEDEATVRTVIDSNFSIAALIQSSRDQGTIRGTLGVDGTPMCRMYYLPDDNLPRPGDLVVTSGVGLSFPKGIPIGEVRESTRGMDSNKQYIVVEPTVDFQHLEYVIVLRYKPRAEAIEGRENGKTEVELVPLESARPSPEVPQIAASLFDEPASSPSDNAEIETPSPTPEPTETPSPTPAPSDTPEPTPDEPVYEYQVVNLSNEPTPTPTPTLAPTPTPYFTPDPNDMTFEEDE